MKDSYKKVCEDLAKQAAKWGKCVMCHDFIAQCAHWPEYPHHADCPVGRARALVKADKRKKSADGPR